VKLIKEHINFTRGQDPKSAMNIGIEKAVNNFIQSLGSPILKKEAGFSDNLNPAFIGSTLMFSALHNKIEFVNYILQNYKDKYNISVAFQWAADGGHVKIMKILLDAGAEINMNDSLALTWAVNKGHVAAVDFLIKHGAEILPKHFARCDTHNEIEYREIEDKLMKAYENR